MAGEIIAGLGALKIALDLVKGFKDISGVSIPDTATIELQEHLLTAYSAMAALTQRVGELEEEVRSFETWDCEKDRYELKGLARGFVAYVLKQPERGTEPAHCICTNCYERRFKSILQTNGEVRVHDHAWSCPSCKAKFPCQSRNMDRMIAEIDQN